MIKNPWTGALALALLMSGVGAPRAADQDKGLAARRTGFAQWRAAHPNAERQFARLKSKTAALTAHLPPPGAAEQPPVIWRVDGAPTEIWDSPQAPLMVVIPAGEYTAGSPDGEAGRQAYEGPRHRVRIATPLAVGKFDVTLGEFTQFVAETHYAAGAGCYVKSGDSFEKNVAADWQHPGFDQTDSDPVVCVNLNDANAYASWLSAKTKHHYRLLSEAEWEYAARAGTVTTYYWGDALGQGHANCADCGSAWGYKQTAPGGSFPPNAFGLYDMSGNVWQWTSDCWNGSYAQAPADGSPQMAGTCDYHVLRGGAWFSHGRAVRAANRYDKYIVAADRNAIHGFRVARSN